jgi:hypothetical protein
VTIPSYPILESVKSWLFNPSVHRVSIALLDWSANADEGKNMIVDGTPDMWPKAPPLYLRNAERVNVFNFEGAGHVYINPLPLQASIAEDLIGTALKAAITGLLS